MKLLKIVILILVFIEAVFLFLYLQSEQKKPRPPIPGSSPAISPASSPVALASPSQIPSLMASATPSETMMPSPLPSASAPAATPSAAPAMTPVPYPTLSPDENESSGEAADFAKGLKHYNKMDYDKAIVCFKEITTVNPKNVWAHYYLFLSYVQVEGNAWSRKSNAFREAKTLMALNAEKSIQDSVTSYLDDVKRREQGEAPVAVPSQAPSPAAARKTETPTAPPSLGGSSGVPTITSSDADDHYEKARNYDRLGNYNFAAAEYSNAIKINPRHIDAYIGRGSLYESKSEFGPALGDYSKAIELKPGDSKNYYRRGQTLQDHEGQRKGKGRSSQSQGTRSLHGRTRVDLLLKEMESH